MFWWENVANYPKIFLLSLLIWSTGDPVRNSASLHRDGLLIHQSPIKLANSLNLYPTPFKWFWFVYTLCFHKFRFHKITFTGYMVTALFVEFNPFKGKNSYTSKVILTTFLTWQQIYIQFHRISFIETLAIATLWVLHLFKGKLLIHFWCHSDKTWCALPCYGDTSVF